MFICTVPQGLISPQTFVQETAVGTFFLLLAGRCRGCSGGFGLLRGNVDGRVPASRTGRAITGALVFLALLTFLLVADLRLPRS